MYVQTLIKYFLAFSTLVCICVLNWGCNKDCPQADFDVTGSNQVAPANLTFALKSKGYTYITWDFGDGNTVSNESRPEHTFLLPGTYTVTVRIGNDKANCEEVTATKSVIISAPPTPVADFTISQPAACNPPCTINFTNTSQNATTYLWDFGVNGATSTEKNPSFTYQNIGTYTILLTVQGPGGSATKSQIITVPTSNTAQPIADFSVNQTPDCYAPCVISFNNLSQNANTYLWDFGVTGATSTDKNSSYTYQYPGSYTVKLTAQGNTSSATKTQTVSIPYPGGLPNTSFATSYEVVSGQSIGGQTTSSENRYFKTVLSSICLLRIHVTNANSKFRVIIYNEANTTSDVYTSPWIEQGTSVEFIAGPLEQGVRYIVIDPATSTAQSYNLSIIQDCSDNSEPNNSFDKATVLNIGQNQVGKILAVNDASTYEDRDILKFTVQNKPAIAYFRLIAPGGIEPIGDYFRYTIYNEANYTSDLEYKNVYAGEAGEIMLGPLAPGDHYIGINTGSPGYGLCHCQSDGLYTMSVTLDYRDANEPNDEPFQNGTQLTIGVPMEGMFAYPNGNKTYDRDWFRFTPVQNGTYRIELIALPISSNTHVNVYDDPGGTSISSFYKNNGLTTYKDLTLTAGNEYWIKVDMNSSTAESNGLYTIKVSAL